VTETMPFVSREYSDQGGRDRKMLTKLLAGYFISHQNIHLLVQVKEVTTISDEQVRAELLVAMAGKPLDSVSQLIDYRADLHHFELTFNKEDDAWLVTAGTWRRASHTDFL
ncbi:MAG: hypothetical protein MI754_11050, partial [Chromatiales bacterium]|nr:hypothetical protein [Chromatiales bacterium]